MREHILYLTRNGLLEPLGQSQILPYLCQLSKHYKITIITFEKKIDLNSPNNIKNLDNQIKSLGMHWIPLRFYSFPKYLAPLFALTQLFTYSLIQFSSNSPPKLVHARSYLPSFIALLLKFFTGTRFIFDMRALWPEELITAGHILRKGFIHRFLLLVEYLCLKYSNGIVTLTKASVSYLYEKYPFLRSKNNFVVIPTCVDLNRFHYSPIIERKTYTFGCIGTVLSGWFLLSWLTSFFDAIAMSDCSCRFEIITRDNPSEILRLIGEKRIWINRLRITSASPSEMPSIIQSHSASIMFYSGGNLSELGRSPTRMAEVLASGRPVIANSGVGDVESILINSKVGLVVPSSDPLEMKASANDLMKLLRDPHLPSRCRQAAQKYFSLDNGSSAYRHLYMNALG